tara:strand:- start:1388 stop:2815 length:1428 start_codon:yes stop_codon:yes gene_type:complete
MNNPFPLFNFLSISKKVALWYAFSLFIMLSLFGFFLYEIFHNSVHNIYDRHLKFEAEHVLPFINVEADTITVDLTDYRVYDAPREGIQYKTYIRIYDVKEQLVYESPFFNEAEEAFESQIPASKIEYSLSHEWLLFPSRTLYYPLKKGEEFKGWLEVTGFEWTLHEEVSQFKQYMIVILMINVIFSILGGYWLSRKALSPVSEITKTVKSISSVGLNTRIPVNYQVRDELTELTETFNIMLNRLQKGFEREKRFTSDAAHELMTPLSSLRSEAEIALRKQRPKEEYQKTIEHMLDEVLRISEMVQLLLQLSRIESVQISQPVPVNISRIIETISEQKKEIAKSKNIEINVQCVPDLYVKAEGTYIEEIIINLLDNAVKYTNSDGFVNIQLKLSSRKAVLHVTDSGIGFSDETKARLFERFYRAPESEVHEQPGSGLGLPLVKAIVEQYNGKIEAYSDGIGKGSTFVVQLPLVEKD